MAPPLPVETREEIEMLQMMGEDCRVWGKLRRRAVW